MYLFANKLNEILQESLPAILDHSPAGSSTKTFLHYGQLILSGDFRQYDYKEFNPDHYDGAMEPPAYDLSKITAPVVLYYGDNDFLADKTVSNNLHIKIYKFAFNKISL